MTTNPRPAGRATAPPPRPKTFAPRPKPTKRTLDIDFNLNQEERNHLAKIMPGIEFKPKFGADKHSHPISSLERRIAEEEALRRIKVYLHTLNVVFTLDEHFIVDIGGNAKRHKDAKRGVVWSCAPDIDSSDYIRHLNWGPPERGPSSDPANSTLRYCKDKVQDCKCVTPIAYLSVHSLYYLSQKDVLKLVNMPGQPILVAVVHQYTKIRGKLCLGEQLYVREGQQVTASIDGKIYQHDACDWLKSRQYSEMINGVVYSMAWDKVAEIGDSLIFTFKATNYPTASTPMAKRFSQAFRDVSYYGPVELSLTTFGGVKFSTFWQDYHMEGATAYSIGKSLVLTDSLKATMVIPKVLMNNLMATALYKQRNNDLIALLVSTAKRSLQGVDIGDTDLDDLIRWAVAYAYVKGMDADRPSLLTIVSSHTKSWWNWLTFSDSKADTFNRMVTETVTMRFKVPTFTIAAGAILTLYLIYMRRRTKIAPGSLPFLLALVMFLVYLYKRLTLFALQLKTSDGATQPPRTIDVRPMPVYYEVLGDLAKTHQEFGPIEISIKSAHADIPIDTEVKPKLQVINPPQTVTKKLVTDICADGRPIPDQDPDTIVEPTNHQPCAAKFGAQLVGFGIKDIEPSLARNCVHNEELALRCRLTVEQHYSDSTVDDYINWCNDSQIMKEALPWVYGKVQTLTPLDYNKWLKRFPKPTQQKLEKARIRGENLHSYQLKNAKSMFRKKELYIKNLIKPRPIMSSHADEQYNEGPHSFNFGKHLCQTWGVDHDLIDRAFNDYDAFYDLKQVMPNIIYTAGYTPLQLGILFHAAVDRCVKPKVLEDDFAEFDGSQHQKLIDHEINTFVRVLDPENVKEKGVFMRSNVMVGVTKFGIFFYMKGRRASGAGRTSVGNTKLNAEGHMFSIVRAGLINQLSDLGTLFVMGDDMVLVYDETKYQITGPVAKFLEKVILEIGLKPKINLRDWYMDAEYLSGSFYPVKCPWGFTYTWGPKIGRLLSKTFWIKEFVSPPMQLAWIRVVAMGMRYDLSAIPILRAAVGRILQLTEGVKASDIRKVHRMKLVDQREVPHNKTPLECFDISLACYRYRDIGIDATWVKALEDEIWKMPLGTIIESDLLKQMALLDCQFDPNEIRHNYVEESGPKVITGDLLMATCLKLSKVFPKWDPFIGTVYCWAKVIDWGYVVNTILVAPVLEELLKHGPYGGIFTALIMAFECSVWGWEIYWKTALMHLLAKLLPYGAAVGVHTAWNTYATIVNTRVSLGFPALPGAAPLIILYRTSQFFNIKSWLLNKLKLKTLNPNLSNLNLSLSQLSKSAKLSLVAKLKVLKLLWKLKLLRSLESLSGILTSLSSFGRAALTSLKLSVSAPDQ